MRRRPRSFVTAAISRGGVQAATMLSMMAAIAKLDTKAFGVFSVAWVLTVIANSIIYSGLYEFLLRTRELEADRDVVFTVMLLEGVAFAAILVGIGVGAAVLGNPGLASSLYTLAIVPLLGAPMAWWDALLTRDGHAASIGMMLFFGELAGSITLLVTLSLGWQVPALLSWRLATAFTTFVLLAYSARTMPRFAWSAARAKRGLRAALPLQGSTVFRMLAMYAADLLLAWGVGTAASGAYRAASRISATGADVFTQPLKPILWSSLAKCERDGNHHGARTVYLDQLRALTFFAWPSLICLAAFSDRLLRAFANPDWIGAAPILSILAIARMPAMLDFFLDPVLVCTGRPRTQFYAQTGATLALVISVAIACSFGAVWVAVGALICAVGLGIVASVLVLRSLNVSLLELLRAVAPSALISILCMGAGEGMFRVLHTGDLSRLLVSIAVMAACLLGTFLVLRKRALLLLPQQPPDPAAD